MIRNLNFILKLGYNAELQIHSNIRMVMKETRRITSFDVFPNDHKQQKPYSEFQDTQIVVVIIITIIK